MEILGKSIEGNSMGSEQTIDNCETCKWIDRKRELSLSSGFGDTVLISLREVESEHINRFHFGEKKR